MKYLILVGDGMGDLPLPELDNRTPLEAAETPAMDRLCAQGELLRVRTIPENMAPGSDVANLSLLGYEPRKVYSGRAPLEAASLGIKLGPDEIACRCNLVTLEDTEDNRLIMRDYSGGHISTNEGAELIKALDRELGSGQIKFYAGNNYRHLMVFRGDLQDLSTVPPHDYPDKEVTEFWQRYLEIPALAGILPRARQLLTDHPVNQARLKAHKKPANGIWLWGQGRPPKMTTIPEQYGINGSLISAVDLLKGIGICSGLQIIEVPGATGYLDTNYAGKTAAALAAIDHNDLVLVHVEAPDEAGHQGLLKDKIQAIEDFDRKIVAPIIKGLKAKGYEFRVAVAMDHYTPISTRTHDVCPVPVALYDSRQQLPGSGRTYTEANGNEHGELLASGREFFDRLLER